MTDKKEEPELGWSLKPAHEKVGVYARLVIDLKNELAALRAPKPPVCAACGSDRDPRQRETIPRRYGYHTVRLCAQCLRALQDIPATQPPTRKKNT